MNLPINFINLISISIRKQIKEYVFDLINHFSNIFVNIKKEDDGIFVDMSEPPKTKANLFATYTPHEEPVNASSSLFKLPLKTYKPKEYLMSSKEIDLKSTFIFDNKLTKSFRNKNFNYNDSELPEFLTNKRIYPSVEEIHPIIKKRKLSNNSIQSIKFLNEQPSSDKKEKKHKKVVKSNKIVIERLQDFLPSNKYILDCTSETITISKEILQVTEDYNRIEIDKKILECDYAKNSEGSINIEVEVNDKFENLENLENL